MKKKTINIKVMLLLFALIPLILVVILLFFITSGIMVRNLEENTKEELMVASKALREYYEYDLLNGTNLVDGFLEYDTEYQTPYGSMAMKVVTNSFDFNANHQEEAMKVMAEYALEMEGQVLSDSMIIIEIKNAEAR